MPTDAPALLTTIEMYDLEVPDGQVMTLRFGAAWVAVGNDRTTKKFLVADGESEAEAVGRWVLGDRYAPGERPAGGAL